MVLEHGQNLIVVPTLLSFIRLDHSAKKKGYVDFDFDSRKSCLKLHMPLLTLFFAM